MKEIIIGSYQISGQTVIIGLLATNAAILAAILHWLIT